MKKCIVVFSLLSIWFMADSNLSHASKSSFWSNCVLLFKGHYFSKLDPNHLDAISGRIFNKMRDVKNIASLKSLPIGEQGVALVASMDSDVFYDVHPFAKLSDYLPIANVLARGVQKFERSIYRTSTNAQLWDSGYDVVRYTVTHFDGATSVLLAFKRETTPFDAMGYGLPDRRSLFHSFYISDGNGLMTQYQYEPGLLPSIEQGYEEAMLAAPARFIRKSIKNQGLFELESPNQFLSSR